MEGLHSNPNTLKTLNTSHQRRPSPPATAKSPEVRPTMLVLERQGMIFPGLHICEEFVCINIYMYIHKSKHV